VRAPLAAALLALAACARPTAAPLEQSQPVPTERVEYDVQRGGPTILQTAQYPDGGGVIYVGDVVPSSTNWTVAQTGETTSCQTGWSDRDHDDHTRWAFRYPSGSPCVKACEDVSAARWATWPRDDAGGYVDTKGALITEGIECFQRCGLVPEITHGPDWKPPTGITLDDGGGITVSGTVTAGDGSIVITSQPKAWANAKPGNVVLSVPLNADTKGARHAVLQALPDGNMRVWVGKAHMGDYSPELLHGAHIDVGGKLLEVLP
jgi:hypothetical protein